MPERPYVAFVNRSAIPRLQASWSNAVVQCCGWPRMAGWCTAELVRCRDGLGVVPRQHSDGGCSAWE